MIENPYLGVGRGFFESGAQVIPHKTHFILLPPERGRKTPILVGVHFVVDGHRLDLYAGVGVSLKKLEEILRQGREPVLAHRTAQHRTARFHPSGRTPHAREEVKIGIDLSRLAEYGKQIGAVMVNAESLNSGSSGPSS